MSKKFIQQHTRKAFNHIAASSDKAPTPLSPTSPVSPPTPLTINVSNPASIVHEIARQKHEQILVRQQHQESEERKKAELLQQQHEQEILKQKEVLAALKIKLEQEKVKVLKDQQQKKDEQLLFEEQLKKEKVLQEETNLRLEKESFEKEKEELILQSQQLQTQIKTLTEASTSVITPPIPTFLLLTDDTPDNEHAIANPRVATPSPEPTGIDPEYEEISILESAFNAVTFPEKETEINLEGNTEINPDNEYEII